MLKRTLYIGIFLLTIYFKVTNSSFLDYMWSLTPYNKDESKSVDDHNLIEHKVPYELEIADEKFLNEAAKLTGLVLSDLDMCQHRVIYKLKNACNKLNGEQLSKLAVMLLNCQSAIEGRTIYPCTSSMTLQECTTNMDPETWTIYHIMSNRARAVCMAIRQDQFRGLVELTVNKLLNTANNQINMMSHLSESQERLEKITSDTIQSVSKSHEVLQEQQEDIKKAQFHGQLAIEQNIQQLVKEKALIKAGHEQLAKMTDDVKTKLESATNLQKMSNKEILNDLLRIQEQAHNIWQKIEKSNNDMIVQSAEAARQYQYTLSQLAQVNATVHSLVELVNTSRTAIDERLSWLSEALGGTGNTIDRVYICISHLLFLMAAMIACAFLNAPTFVRYAVIFIVPLNLSVSLQQGIDKAMDLTLVAFVISLIAIVHQLFCAGLALLRKCHIPKPSLTWRKILPRKQIILQKSEEFKNINNSNNSFSQGDLTLDESSSESYLLNENIIDTRDMARHVSSTSNIYDIVEEDDNLSSVSEKDNVFISPTPPRSRSGYFLTKTRSRSNTPMMSPASPTSGVIKQTCTAITRLGSTCKLSAIPGRDYCHRHKLGNSMVG